jgi:gluconokinase
MRANIQDTSTGSRVPPIVVMGASGSGKTTVGKALAEQLDIPFVDGDELHPEANRTKMSAGIPLSEEDRQPWLLEIADALAARSVVIACSALRRRYRDCLRAHAPNARFLFLDGSEELLADRLAERVHEFMPASLLASQVDALERPDPDEDVLVADIRLPVDELVALAVARLGTK